MTQSILLADDDPAIQALARAALAHAGFDVEVVPSGRALLERVAVTQPDVILLDWLMPEMSGLDVCTQLKANTATAAIPVIFLSAKSEASDVAAGLAAGAVGHIAKPFNPMTLGAQVRELLGG